MQPSPCPSCLSDEQAVATDLHYRSYTRAAAALYCSRSALYRRIKRWRRGQLASLPIYVAITPHAGQGKGMGA